MTSYVKAEAGLPCIGSDNRIGFYGFLLYYNNDKKKVVTKETMAVESGWCGGGHRHKNPVKERTKLIKNKIKNEEELSPEDEA